MPQRTRIRGRSTRNSKSGFTLVELLVVIAIIGMLVGLALPVLNSAREKGRMMECMNNMRNVAAGANIYEQTKRQYPGYINALRLYNGQFYTDTNTGQKHGVSYVVPLLTYLDQPLLDKIWRTPKGAQIGSGTSGSSSSSGGGSSSMNVNPNMELKILICPSDPPTMAGANLSYAVNSGMQDTQGTPASGSSQGMPKDFDANGVFFDLYTGNPQVSGSSGSSGGSSGGGGGGGSSGSSSSTGGQSSGLPQIRMSNDYISRADGVGQTCMLSENVDAGYYSDYTEAKLGLVWTGSGTVDTSQDPPSLKPPDDNMRINVGIGNSELQGGSVQQGGSSGSSGGSSGSSGGSSQSTIFARPSAFHPKGVNMAFCDGKVRFVSDSMDYYVYCLLMSTNGARVRQPGSTQVLQNFNRPLNESWYLQ